MTGAYDPERSAYENFMVAVGANRAERARQFAILRRYIISVGFLLLALQVLTWWAGEHDSCVRANATRVAVNTQAAAIERLHHGDIPRSAHPPVVRTLDCSGLFPDTTRSGER